MTHIELFEPGCYQYVPGVFQYSGGVGAVEGYAIERVRFQKPVPLQLGVELIDKHLATVKLPRAAFCQCELRSPGQFTEAGFRAFNELYVGTLADWGIFRGGINPVARSNVCPEVNAPAEPSFYAFAYTVPADDPRKTFAISGSGGSVEGKSNYHDHIVRRGDTSPEGMSEKAKFVLSEMERRMAGFAAGWDDVTATQVYSVFDFFAVLGEVEARRAALHGLTWHFARPPIVDLDFEMDCRRVFHEHVLGE